MGSGVISKKIVLFFVTLVVSILVLGTLNGPIEKNSSFADFDDSDSVNLSKTEKGELDIDTPAGVSNKNSDASEEDPHPRLSLPPEDPAGEFDANTEEISSSPGNYDEFSDPRQQGTQESHKDDEFQVDEDQDQAGSVQPDADIVNNNFERINAKSISTDTHQLCSEPAIVCTEAPGIGTIHGAPEPQTSTLTIVLGAQNAQYPGQGHGYIMHDRTGYYSFAFHSQYLFYCTGNPNAMPENRGWTVFNITDLAKYENARITSGQVLWRHNYHYNTTQVDFWTMKSIPYNTGWKSKGQAWYDEISGTGSILLGQNSLASGQVRNKCDMRAEISTTGINWINDKLNNSNYDLVLGSRVSKIAGEGGTLNCADVRLVINISFTEYPDDNNRSIAVGDKECGGVSSGGTQDQYTGHGIIVANTNSRGYATWNASSFKTLLPDSGPNGEKVIMTGIGLKLDLASGTFNNFEINHMKSNPAREKSYLIYTDIADGTNYIKFYNNSWIMHAEFYWDLGPDALAEFNKTIDGTKSFFALGFMSDKNTLFCGPKLVIEWTLGEAPQSQRNATIDIDPDTLNPKSQGKWITCYIELPGGYNVSSIDIGTILLNGQISAENKPTGIGDHDGDGITDLMVKFDRQKVIELLDPGESVEIRVTFEVDGEELSGKDYIRVLDK